MPMLHLLAQAATSAPADLAAPLPLPLTHPAYHVAWEKWITFYDWQVAFRGTSALILTLLLGFLLTRIFRQALQKYHLGRATRWAIIALACYFTLLASHPYLMVDNYDLLSLFFHKAFVAILLVVAIRYLDRLVILPLLTRLSGTAPSRFIHQIILSVISVFVFAGYCSWAFSIEIASFLAGSAILSIVLGLALQETLGNFFSGMVLQASVPFKPGDWIQIGDIEGRIVEMTWRAVTLLTPANNYVLIPNSAVAKERITNYHTPSLTTASSITITLDYSLPPHDAMRVLTQAAADTPGVNVTPAPSAALAAFGDTGINYKVVFWINDPDRHAAIEQSVRANLWYRLYREDYQAHLPARPVPWPEADKKLAADRIAAHSHRLAALRKSLLFSELAPELLEKLAAETRDFALAAGQNFYRQDDPGDSLFILQSGVVNITVRTQGPSPRDIDAGDAAAPAFFGEISAFTGQPRTATIRAKTDVRAIEIDRDHLQNLLSRDPALMKHFSQIVAQRQAEREELLKKLGAPAPTANPNAPAESVLERMTRLFTRRGR